MLLIRIHNVSCTCEDARQERMVEILPIVMVADGAPEQGIHLFRYALTVTTPDGIKQRSSIPLLRAVIKPADDGRLEDLPDLCIRNHQRNHAIWNFTLIIRFTCPRQVTCQVECAPEVIF